MAVLACNQPQVFADWLDLCSQIVTVSNRLKSLVGMNANDVIYQPQGTHLDCGHMAAHTLGARIYRTNCGMGACFTRVTSEAGLDSLLVTSRRFAVGIVTARAGKRAAALKITF